MDCQGNTNQDGEERDKEWGVIRRGNEAWETTDSEKQTEGLGGGGDCDRPVMGIKEGTYCMVHWVLYANNESWNFTSKTKDILYGD